MPAPLTTPDWPDYDAKTMKQSKPCKHQFVFDASFLRKGPTTGVCKKCGHKQTFGAKQ